MDCRDRVNLQTAHAISKIQADRAVGLCHRAQSFAIQRPWPLQVKICAGLCGQSGGERVAVYTQLTEHDLEPLLASYELGRLVSLIGIAEGVENSNYLLLTDRGRFILTIYEKRVRREDLPYFLSLLAHLSARGFPSPQPLRTAAGDMLTDVAGKPAAVVTFLAGVWPRRQWPEHCRALGGVLATMHRLASDFDGFRANDLSVGTWRQLFNRTADAADDVQTGLRSKIERELDILESQWPADLPAGVIHADLFPDNVFFQRGVISGVIDFYFACNDFFAYDIAVCLNAWCFEIDGAFNITKARHFLSAYRDGRSFSDQELHMLPLLCRGATMRFLLTRLYDWVNTPVDALVRPKNPLEYWQKLRFHQAVSSPAAYGLD